MVNGVVNFTKLGKYTADVYYQASDTNLDINLATLSYSTCLDVLKNSAEQQDDFDCNQLNSCANFNAKLSSVAVDGTTITGDGTPSSPLSASASGSVQSVTGDGVDNTNPANPVLSFPNADEVSDATTTNKFTTTAQINKLAGIEDGAEVNNISDANAAGLTGGGESTLHYHDSDRNRANHTGTQTASTISDFATAVSSNAAVAANTTKLASIQLAQNITITTGIAEIIDNSDQVVYLYSGASNISIAMTPTKLPENAQCTFIVTGAGNITITAGTGWSEVTNNELGRVSTIGTSGTRILGLLGLNGKGQAI